MRMDVLYIYTTSMQYLRNRKRELDTLEMKLQLLHTCGHHVGTRKQTRVLWKSSLGSELLSHLFPACSNSVALVLNVCLFVNLFIFPNTR